MIDFVPMHLIADHIRAANAWLRDFVFVIDALVLGLIVSMVVVGGVNPLDNPALLIGILACVGILISHHVWYVHHRFEVDHERSHVLARERRGY
jgi:hypothetical protein